MYKNYWLRRKAIREDALIIYPETYGVKTETMTKRQLLAQIEALREKKASEKKFYDRLKIEDFVI